MPHPHRHDNCVVVLGATSLVGSWLLEALVREDFQVMAVSRKPARGREADDAVRWQVWDVAAQSIPCGLSAAICVSLMPLWLLPPLIKPLAESGLKRLVAFSSTSAITKARSSVPEERQLASHLLDAETALAAACSETGVSWTVFRPTLIYGAGRDKNVSEIGRFIERFHFFPVLAGGRGMRQPVHAADLARACIQVLDRTASHGKTYCLSGGESLTYRRMVERVFLSLGRRPRIIDVPESLVRPGVHLARLLPRYRHVNVGMLERMAEDLVCDHSEATRDFGYEPRPLDLSDAPWVDKCRQSPAAA